ncbi:MAG: LptE family protein [Bacteroidia bacterium]
MQEVQRRFSPLVLMICLFLAVFTQGCPYSFTGGKPKAGLETVTVNLFDNNASLVNPTLAVDLTEKIKDKFISASSLRLANTGGDMEFEGEIVQYDVRPVAIQGNETAASNRLTVGVHVKYTCEKYPDDSWDKSFSQFSDFSSSLSLSGVEADLVKDIVDRIAQDIFNKALSNW